jgi:predicted transcriptional regulator
MKIGFFCLTVQVSTVSLEKTYFHPNLQSLNTSRYGLTAEFRMIKSQSIPISKLRKSTMIENICTQDVVTISQDRYMVEAVDLMLKKSVGCIVVVDSEDLMPMPVGILTDRDILMRVIAKGLSLEKMKISEVMTKTVVVVSSQTSINKALGMMRLNQVRRLPLINAQGELVGIVTLDDVLDFLADELNQLAQLVKCRKKQPGYRE